MITSGQLKGVFVMEVKATSLVLLKALDDDGLDIVVFLPIMVRCPQMLQLPK